jgi:hypothetical protein
MLKNARTRLLSAITGSSAWSHPYSDPFTCYADGGDSGGDGGDDGQGNDSDDNDDSGTDGDADDSDGDQGDEKLGEKGVKALRELRRENRQLKAQLRQNGAITAAKTSAKGATEGDDDTDTEAIREKAREEARAEVWNERVEAAAIAAASGRLANPNRVAQLLGEDLADIPKDSKGRPDRDAISELIDDLLESDPYLAAPATGTGRRFQGGADGGARKPAKKTAASLGEAVATRLAGKTG